MARKRLPGRPPTHGAYARPTRDRRTRRLRRAFETALTADFGELSGREAILVGMTADSLVRWCTLNSYLDGAELVTKDGPHPALKCYVSLGNCVRRNIETLGLRARQAEKTLTLGEYLARHEVDPAPEADAEEPEAAG